MEYMNCQQAAEKWHVGSRIVRRWCQQRRISGVQKQGKSYYLPVDSLPPSDRRLHRADIKEQTRLAMLMDTDIISQNHFERRFMAYTELTYQGYLEEAEQHLTILLQDAKTDSCRLPVLILLSALKTHLGKAAESAQALQEMLAITASGAHPEYEHLVAIFYDQRPVLPKKEIADELLPFFLLRSTRNIIMSSIFQPDTINMHHLEILSRIIDNIGSELVQAYFHALLAVASLLTKDKQLQQYHEGKAREIILRRKWYLLFAEYYYFLDWQLDHYLTDKAELTFVHNQTQKLFESYIKCACTKADFTQPELMTPKLLKVAVLRSLNQSNAEIARHMDTTPYFVRKYLNELAICTNNATQERLKEIVHTVMWFM